MTVSEFRSSNNTSLVVEGALACILSQQAEHCVLIRDVRFLAAWWGTPPSLE